MKKIAIACFVSTIASLLLFSCTSFSNPIIKHSDSIIDESLLGLWRENPADSESDIYILVLKDNNNLTYKTITFNTSNYEFESDVLEYPNLIYSGFFDNEKYIIVYLNDNNSYFFWKYELENDILRLFSIDETFIENAINEKQLNGKISGQGFKKEIFVDEDTDTLQKFVKENKQQLFNTCNFVEYKKQLN